MAKTQSRELGFYCYVAWLASYDLPICRAYIRCSVRQHESVGDIVLIPELMHQAIQS